MQTVERKKVSLIDKTTNITYILYEDEVISFSQKFLLNTSDIIEKAPENKNIDINTDNIPVSKVIINQEEKSLEEQTKEFNNDNKKARFSFVKELKKERVARYSFKDYLEKPELELNKDSIVQFTNKLKIFFGRGKKDKWAAMVDYNGVTYAVSDVFYFKLICQLAKKYGNVQIYNLFYGLYEVMMRDKGKYRHSIDKSVLNYINYIVENFYKEREPQFKFLLTEVYYCMIAEEHFSERPVCGAVIKMTAIAKLLIADNKIVDDEEIPVICKDMCSTHTKGENKSQEILKMARDYGIGKIIINEKGLLERNLVY